MSEAQPISVLVVDDDKFVREMLAPVLAAKGFAVSDARSAAEALALVLQRSFDVVITDIRMPRDSGLALLAMIKKYRPGIHVILMTGNPELTESDQVRSLASAVFLKPFTPKTIIDAVRQICAVPKVA